MLRIRVKYLMWLRDKTSVDSEEYIVDKELTIRELIHVIRNKHSSLEKLLDNIFSRENPVIILVNGRSISNNPDYVLSNNDEVILMPPVSGG